MPKSGRQRSVGLSDTIPVASARSALEQRRDNPDTSLALSQAKDGMRRAHPRGSHHDGTLARPSVQTRTASAPLLSTGRPVTSKGKRTMTREPGAILTSRGAHEDDEHAELTGAIQSFQLLESPEIADALAEINIAVIGGESVDKSGFVAKALGLSQLPQSHAAERKITYRRQTYLVRLLEVAVEDVDIDDDEIGWPSTVDHKQMPRIDGALALYDVRSKRSIEQLLDTLDVISKEALPTILVSCKCETPIADRQVDPSLVEDDLRRTISGMHTLRISDANPDSYKRTVHTMLEAIVEGSPEYPGGSLANRPRALSTAVRAVSPRPPGNPNHSRASSEFTGSLHKERRYGKQDNSIAEHGTNNHLRVARDQAQEQVYGSFLLEESGSDRSLGSRHSSTDGDEHFNENGPGVPDTGMTFDELVDRLLAQQSSKGDVKFSAIFLALYRNFAAPSQLLEAIVDRFEALERHTGPQMTKTMHQLRYVTILEQWIATYPGDFAYARTKRQLQLFVSKLAETRIFSMAAKEISSDLESAGEDDDTHWAISDRDRDTLTGLDRDSVLSTATTLIDDPSFQVGHDSNYTNIHKHFAATNTLSPQTAANAMQANVESAQRQAALLQPIPRYPITKIQWRALMEIPDEVVAFELTRIDWIMFSAIRPRDLVRDCSLSKDQKLEYRNVAHVTRMSDHFNTLASWVVNYILLRDKPKHRALILEKFMRVARKLREMNNYNSLGAIIAGVKSTPIHRLAATRELISPNIGRDWLKLEILMAPSRSHSAYRLAWENSTSERIPYLPLHRRDLSTAEQGNKTWIGDEDDGRINWRKFEIIGDVIVGIQRAQETGYKSMAGSRGSEQVRELVLDAKLVREEEDLYELSVRCEPVAVAGERNTSITTSGKLKDLFKRSVFDTSRLS